MLAPYRIAAAPDPGAPDPADAYEALLRTRARRTRQVATAAVAAMVSVFALAMAETPASRARPLADDTEAHVQLLQETRSTLEMAQLSAVRERARMRSAIEDARSREPRTEGPCPTRLPAATRLVHGRQAFPFAVVESAPASWTSPSADVLLEDIDRAGEHLRAGRVFDATLYANALRAPGRLRFDVIVIADVQRPATASDGRTFLPGEVSGQAYLYDFAERRVTCTCAVHVTSSKALEYTYVDGANATLAPAPNLASSLRDDLEINVQRAIAAGLVAIAAPTLE